MSSKNLKFPRFLRWFVKTIAWIIISILILLLAIAGLIQIPAIQNRLVTEAVTFLRKKIKTEVRLDHLSLSFPDNVVLTGMYVEDQSADTLLYAGRIKVDADLWGVIRKNVHVSEVQLDGVRANVKRNNRDSTFNFDYIVRAFSDSVNVEIDEESEEDTTSASWDIRIDALSLTQSKISYHDLYTGTVADVSVGNLQVDMDEFDLKGLVFRADEISLQDIDAVLTQYSSSSPEKESPSESVNPLPDLGFGKIGLENVKFRFEEKDQIIDLALADVEVDARDIDLNKQVLEFDKIAISNSFVAYQVLQVDSTKDVSSERDTLKNSPWKISLDEIELLRNSFQYYDFTKPENRRGLDVNHIWLTGINIQANDITWNENDLTADLNNLTAQNQDGFVIHTFQADVSLIDGNLTMSDFIIQTPNSKLGFDLSAQYDPQESIEKLYQQAFVKLNLKESTIALQDVVYLSPTILDSLSVGIPVNSTVRIQTRLQGRLSDLSIEELTVKALQQTYLSLHGNISGLPDSKKIKADVVIPRLYTTRKDLRSVLADSLIPTSVEVPEWIEVNARVKGSLVQPNVKALMKCSYGSIDAELKMDSSGVKDTYSGNVAVHEFDIGKFLKNENSLGSVDLAASVAGKGFTTDNLNVKVNLSVNHIEYKGYDYQDFIADGTIKKYLFSGTAGMADKNLNFSLKGDVDYTADTVSYKLLLDVVNADLHALHLSEGQLKTRGSFVLDVATPDYKILNGDLAIRNFAVFNGSTLYSVDSLMVVSIDQQGKSELTIRSDVITGDFKGTLNVFSMPSVITQHINRYWNHKAFEDVASDEEQNFEFDLVIHNTDLLTEVFFPKLDPFIPGEISGKFNSIENKLDLHLDLARLSYDGIGTDSVRLDVSSNDKSLDYKFSVRDLRADTVQIEAFRISGKIVNDSIYNKLTILDRKLKEKYRIGSSISRIDNGYQFRFLSDEIILNRKKWEVSSDNYVQFFSSGIRPHEFYIALDSQRVELTRTEDRDSLVRILFKGFDLENITSLVEGTTPAKGLVEGDLNISVSESGSFNSDLYIRQFELFEQPWGDLTFALGRTRTGPLNFDLRVEGDDVMVHADGYYTSNEAAPEIHLKAEVSKLNLAKAEPLTLGQVKNMSGQLTGELTIQGIATSPEINGQIVFQEASFTPRLSNSTWLLKNETIAIEKSGLTFHDFKIRDRKNNEASIDGSILTESFRDFKLNLNLTTNNFQVLNSTDQDNKMFYGHVWLNAYARITGSSQLPIINLRASLSDDSEFTYVIPQSQKGVTEQQGIVTFVDKDARKDPFLASLNIKDTVKSRFKGIDLTANIEFSDRETFNIVIDPITGDRLSVRGNSTLTLLIDSKGDMNLSGRYEISEGSYDLSFYKLVKRNFSIVPGSSIIWSGDPYSGDIDISALYKVETSPIDLVANHLTSSDPQEMNMYRQRLPFEVYLIMKGDLLSPDISFRLDMPENKQNAFGGTVYAKIQDLNTRESELNKQVFSLLVLKRFMSEDPFNSQGSDFSTAARTSVSRLLTEQLNRLSENVKGIELSFDVKSYEDYSTGQGQGETQVQLGVTKNLFDERLVVKVSGNFDVEGEDQKSQSSFSDYIGDLALEYKLTEDGRFRVTGFRNSNYDMIDGELIETGAGLIYIKDYNTLRELFRANAKDK